MIHPKRVWIQGTFLSASLFVFITSPNAGHVKKQLVGDRFAAESISAKTDTADTNTAFLVNAAEINLDEIMLGEQAQQKSKMPDIIELGKMMETDHQRLQDELISLAKQKSITLPASADKDAGAAYKKFKNASGSDFDVEYCDMMVNGHRNAIKEFEHESSQSNDPEVRKYAADALPLLRKHLDHSIACQKKYQK